MICSELYNLDLEHDFADEKEKHAMRYIQYRGLTQVTDWVKLSFVAMNLNRDSFF